MLKWEDLPEELKNDEVYHYYKILRKHSFSLAVKRVSDVLISLLLIVVLSPVFLVLSVLIKTDSEGPVFFRQTRVTQYGKRFRIYKFRTMVQNAEQVGNQVTSKNDTRITKIGSKIRDLRLDEIPQLFNVLKGEMSFVGTRPEVEKYVARYTDRMKATLLMPAGITSEASIMYKDEARLLENAEDADEVYVEKVLPEKMKYNLCEIENFGFGKGLRTMVKTIAAVFR